MTASRTKIDALPGDVRDEINRRLITGTHGSYKRLSAELKSRGYGISARTLERHVKRLRAQETYQSLVKRVHDAHVIASAPGQLVAIAESVLAHLLIGLERTAKDLETINDLDKRAGMVKIAAEAYALLLKSHPLLKALRAAAKEREQARQGQDKGDVAALLAKMYGG